MIKSQSSQQCRIASLFLRSKDLNSLLELEQTPWLNATETTMTASHGTYSWLTVLFTSFSSLANPGWYQPHLTEMNLRCKEVNRAIKRHGYGLNSGLPDSRAQVINTIQCDFFFNLNLFKMEDRVNSSCGDASRLLYLYPLFLTALKKWGDASMAVFAASIGRSCIGFVKS